MVSSGRTVLLIGDEALAVYKVTSGATVLVDTVPWQADNFEMTVADLVQRDCKGNPVLILNDMTDQHFKGGQRIPRVGPLDKAKVLNRKLQVAFPNCPIRGSIPVSGSERDPQGSRYLFAGVPSSEPVIKTLEAVKLSLAPVVGFYLLPVESASMVKALAGTIGGKKRKASRWVMFLGQHRGGALRQVIIRDGQLAMTRMTPVVDSDTNVDQWVAEVAQEFKSTLSYLSRFGFSANDGADVIVSATSEAGEALQKRIDVPCNYYSCTAPEAAQMLKIKIGVQDEPRYADPLHVGYIGRKRKFVLPMQSVAVEKIQKPRQMASVAVLVLLIANAYLGWLALDQGQKYMDVQQDVQTQNRALSMAEVDFQTAQEKLQEQGVDVLVMKAANEAYEQFRVHDTGALKVVYAIGSALKENARLDTLTIEHVKDKNNKVSEGRGYYPYGSSPEEDNDDKGTLLATLKMSFSKDRTVQVNAEKVKDLARDLTDLLPDYEVKIKRQVAVPRYSSVTEGVVGRNQRDIISDTQADEYVAEITITGPKKDG